MRCFFDLHGPDGILLDDVGVDVACPMRAYDDAVEQMRECLEDEIPGDLTDWVMNVVDAAGASLFVIPLQDVVPASAEELSSRYAH